MKKPDRLYELLPAIYRQRDAERGEPLRALLSVMAEQVEIVEDEIDRLYDNWFIETCDNWVVPYIGDLLGFRAVHEGGQSATSRAVDKILVSRRQVAHTIAARRRRGTLAILEELARDVAGWPVRAVEFYRLLAVTQPLNHFQPARGQTADMRAMRALDLIGGAFERMAHNVDVRRTIAPRRVGRFNVPSAAVFVWRLRAYRVSNTPAACIEEAGTGENCFTFSVLGNNSPLFTSPATETDPAQIADELNVPAAIRLAALQKPIRDARGRIRRVEASEDYYGDLASVRRGAKSIAIRAPRWPGADASGFISAAKIIPRDLRHWSYAPPDGYVAVDPNRGRIVFPAEQAPREGVWVSYYYGFSANMGGGEYRRPISGRQEATVAQAARGELRLRLQEWQKNPPKDAIIELTESEVYDDLLRLEVPAGHSLQIRAAQRRRPIIRLLDYRGNEPDALQVVMHPGSTLILDGLLITGRSVQIRSAPREPARTERYPRAEEPNEYKTKGAQSAAPPTAPEATLMPEQVDVLIRHCTLVPGWSLECDCTPCQPAKGSIHLVNLHGRVRVEHSILGAVRVQQDEVRAEPLDLRISDSVVDATSLHRAALSRPGGDGIAHAALTIARSTVLGEIQTHVMRLGENCIFAGHVCVARRQIGCVRFSYVVPGSRTPRRYQCQPDLATRLALEKLPPHAPPNEKSRSMEHVRRRVRPQFNSMRYGSPAYCQLAPACPDQITRGADDESEMGAFHHLFQPQRALNLRAALDEFTPAGLETGIVYVT